MAAPSFKEDHISQLPALKLLMNMGWKYLPPEQALEARGGRTSNVLLETILKEQLQTINTIEYKGKEFPFSDINVNNAILSIRNLPVQDGFIASNKAFYELITLGRSFEQSVLLLDYTMAKLDAFDALKKHQSAIINIATKLNKLREVKIYETN